MADFNEMMVLPIKTMPGTLAIKDSLAKDLDLAGDGLVVSDSPVSKVSQLKSGRS